MFIQSILRYQPLPELVTRLGEVHRQYRMVTKQCDRLKAKIAAAAEQVGVCLDDEVHEDMKVLSSGTDKLLEDLPKDSFRRIFWQQQIEAAAQKDSRTMRWHPLMIRWCLYLRHR